jgi:uncharacterized protein YbjT (DUF2867 family)
MKIVVIGGTGLIGSKLVSRLSEHGHEAVAASPNTGVNTLTGEGLADVTAGAAVVVDVSNSPSFEDAAVLEFFETSTRHLLAAEAVAGVGHHVALSVVGTERLQQSGYFRAKGAQEKLIENSGIPYSVVHATQFFEFARSMTDAATEGSTVRFAPVLFQPIAAVAPTPRRRRPTSGPSLCWSRKQTGSVTTCRPGSSCHRRPCWWSGAPY